MFFTKTCKPTRNFLQYAYRIGLAVTADVYVLSV